MKKILMFGLLLNVSVEASQLSYIDDYYMNIDLSKCNDRLIKIKKHIEKLKVDSDPKKQISNDLRFVEHVNKFLNTEKTQIIESLDYSSICSAITLSIQYSSFDNFFHYYDAKKNDIELSIYHFVLLSKAASYGRIDVLKFLLDIKCPCPYNFKGVLREAASCGQVGIIDFIFQNYMNKIDKNNLVFNMLKAAIEAKDGVEVVRYFGENGMNFPMLNQDNMITVFGQAWNSPTILEAFLSYAYFNVPQNTINDVYLKICASTDICLDKESLKSTLYPYVSDEISEKGEQSCLEAVLENIRHYHGPFKTVESVLSVFCNAKYSIKLLEKFFEKTYVPQNIIDDVFLHLCIYTTPLNITSEQKEEALAVLWTRVSAKIREQYEERYLDKVLIQPCMRSSFSLSTPEDMLYVFRKVGSSQHLLEVFLKKTSVPQSQIHDLYRQISQYNESLMLPVEQKEALGALLLTPVFVEAREQCEKMHLDNAIEALRNLSLDAPSVNVIAQFMNSNRMQDAPPVVAFNMFVSDLYSDGIYSVILPDGQEQYWNIEFGADQLGAALQNIGSNYGFGDVAPFSMQIDNKSATVTYKIAICKPPLLGAEKNDVEVYTIIMKRNL